VKFCVTDVVCRLIYGIRTIAGQLVGPFPPTRNVPLPIEAHISLDWQ